MRRCVVLLLLLIAFATASEATIHYRVSVGHPEQHLFHVTMTVPDGGRELRVAIPAWNALYQIRDFAARVQNVSARSLDTKSDAVLSVRKLDKQTWIINASAPEAAPALGDVEISYAIYWDDPGPFNSQLNAHHAFLNLAEILFYLPDRRLEDTSVQYLDLPPSWRATEELPSGGEASTFVAENYDAMVDAPAELGTPEEFAFDVNGAHFRVVVDGENWKRAPLQDNLEKIVRYETTLMGGPPFKEYTFFFHFGDFRTAGGGGMEHANGTAIATSSSESAPRGAAHEFFHAWNVKRIRPQSLEPVDYSKEMWTRALWFAEGVTSTYGSYSLLRSGIWNRERFLEDLAGQLTELDSRRARSWESVEESSLDAWLEKYDIYNRPEYSISYYNKGQIAGDFLDLEIRDATDNRASLDDVMREMLKEFGQGGRYYDDSADIEAVSERVAGKSLKDFFSQYIAGTAEIPYDDFLGLAGLRTKSMTDEMPDFGFSIMRGPENLLLVEEVVPGSTAEVAGIRPGDVLLKLGDDPFPRNPFRALGGRAPGDVIHLWIRHESKEAEVTFALGKREQKRYEIEEIPDATGRQKRIREGWLNGTTDTPAASSSNSSTVPR
ncbi:MAG: M61 family metallopeptidase [Candidatus Acidiferrales bacterium]